MNAPSGVPGYLCKQGRRGPLEVRAVGTGALVSTAHEGRASCSNPRISASARSLLAANP